MTRKWKKTATASLIILLSTVAWISLRVTEGVALGRAKTLLLSEFAKWAKPCRKILFDLGANRGDTIERWYSAKKFVGRNSGLVSVNTLFPAETRREFCVVSFEPNPRFTEALIKISSNANDAGHRSKVYTNTAAGDEDGTVSLFLDESSTDGYGSSVLQSKKVNFGGRYHALGKTVKARQIKFSRMLQILRKGTQVVAKIDIEGAEYQLLRSLIISGVACLLDVLIIEWHGHKISDRDWPTDVEKSLKWLLESSECNVKVLHDD